MNSLKAIKPDRTIERTISSFCLQIWAKIHASGNTDPPWPIDTPADWIASLESGDPNATSVVARAATAAGLRFEEGLPIIVRWLRGSEEREEFDGTGRMPQWPSLHPRLYATALAPMSDASRVAQRALINQGEAWSTFLGPLELVLCEEHGTFAGWRWRWSVPNGEADSPEAHLEGLLDGEIHFDGPACWACQRETEESCPD